MQKKRWKRKKRKKRLPCITWLTDDMFSIRFDDEDINSLFSSIIVEEVVMEEIPGQEKTTQEATPDTGDTFPDGEVFLS
jgi:hypothetical protein